MARLYALQLADQRAMERQGVRENPIRRSGYAGGAAPTEPLEFALASDRAMEIQHRRTNSDRKGATPTMGVSEMRGGNFLTKYIGLTKSIRDKARKGGNHTKAHYEHDREGKLLHETMEAHEAEGRAMRGGRAVPSSGLSQFRGGSNGRMVGAGKGSESESDEEYEGGARDAEIMARESASRPAIRSGLSDQHSVEAKEMGRHLGRHLVSMRGSGFYDLFTKGIVEAGQQSENTAKQTGMPNPNATSAPPPPMTSEPPTSEPPTEEPPTEQKGGALFHRRRDMLGEKEDAHAEHTARRFGMVRKGGASIFSGIMPKKEPQYRTMEYTRADYERDQQSAKKRQEDKIRRGDVYGAGFFNDHKQIVDKGRQMEERRLREENKVEPTVRRSPFELKKITSKGGYLSGEYEGMGDEECGQTRSKGKGRRAPAGPNDGRRKRAEIVKKVMAEKGMKMIEASKYVKEHNLY